MDSSPLIQAFDHAKNASLATETTTAINQHSLAAGEFATASKDTRNHEALRTLRLLEQHHTRLSQLLKVPTDHPVPPPIIISDDDTPSSGQLPLLATDSTSPADPTATTTRPTTSQPRRDSPYSVSDTIASPYTSDATSSARTTAGAGPTSAAAAAAAKSHSLPLPSLQKHRQTLPARDLTSSIASNLASARGIRSSGAPLRGNAVSPSLSNDQAPGNIAAARSNTPKSGAPGKGKPSWIPPTASFKPQTQANPAPAKSIRNKPVSPTEDGFFRFSTAFGSLVNVLSAPLAYAGLPLNPDDPEPEAPPPPSEPSHPRRQKPNPMSAPSSHSASADPDLKKIYSKAALRAVSQEGNLTSDSFYVVPTSGHTMSYAGILNFAEKEKRRKEASHGHSHAHGGDMEDIPEDIEEDDFVDARETQVPLSPGVRKRVGKSQGDKELRNTVEELYMENQGLKDMLDKLSKRLQAFESSAQESSMALAASMRLTRPTSPVSPVVISSGGDSSGGGAGRGDAGHTRGQKQDGEAERRKMELEKQLVEALKKVDELEKDNYKQDKALAKYREKWEKLKAGARARREAQSFSMEGTQEL